MKRIVKNALVALAGNRSSQRVLERLVLAQQWLMGIGAGDSPASSGEHVVVDILRKTASRFERPLCVLDVGANRGQFLSMIVTGLRGVPFHVHAFEPSTFAFRSLVEAYGGSSEVTLNNVGLGKEKGKRTLHYNENGSGIASLYRRRLDHFGIEFGQSEVVTIDTLDDYSEGHSLSFIDLLKLDVEGHELDVLHGASKLLGAARVDMITFEFGGCNIDSRTFLQDFFYFFKEHGSFHLYRITPSGYLASIDEYREFDEQFRTTNFLARRTAST